MPTSVNIGSCECCDDGPGDGTCECCQTVKNTHTALFATVECTGQSFEITQGSPGSGHWFGGSQESCGGNVGMTCSGNLAQVELQIDGVQCKGIGTVVCEESSCDPVYFVFDVELEHTGGSCDCPTTCRVIVTQ